MGVGNSARLLIPDLFFFTESFMAWSYSAHPWSPASLSSYSLFLTPRQDSFTGPRWAQAQELNKVYWHRDTMRLTMPKGASHHLGTDLGAGPFPSGTVRMHPQQAGRHLSEFVGSSWSHTVNTKYVCSKLLFPRIFQFQSCLPFYKLQ